MNCVRKMWKLIVVLAITAPLLVTCFPPNSMIGPGRWLVQNILECDDADQYDNMFEVSRKKMNRTHDCFNLHMDFGSEFNSSYSIILDIYKEVDGGFKFFQTMADDCACDFIKKHAADNMRRALELAHIDPPDCPVPKGKVDIKEFIMDYTELPLKGLYGYYEVNLYLLFQEEKKGCLKVQLNFDEQNLEDDDSG